MDDIEAISQSDISDLDFSFTSSTTNRTFTSSSARSSLGSSSLTLSFSERISISTISTTNKYYNNNLHHRMWDPHWSSIKAAKNLSPDGNLHLRHLKLIRHLGSGNLGRVYLCQLRDCTSVNFALKVIDKESLNKKKLSHVQMEAQILSTLDHPFLPTLYAHLEASHYTCLLIDYCPNGDLHSLLRKQPFNRLPLQAVKFYAAEVLVALEYLHANGIVYRDLKPENILLQENGHVMLSDFDLCFKSLVFPTFRTCNYVHHKKGNETIAEFVAEPTTAFSRSCVGTHEYLAPELVSGYGHGNGVDWWAFGVLIFELLFGITPFKGKDKESTLRNIMSTQDVIFPRVVEEEKGMMDEVKDLIWKLLIKDPKRRLGCVKGATDVKRHRFFNGINWALIRNYDPPLVNGHGLVKKGKAHGNHVIRVSSRRRHWCWPALRCFTRRGSCYRNSNSNYFRYKTRKCD